MKRETPGTGGRFITLEGGEGAGKTTQISRLAQALAPLVPEVVTTREPGGSPGAEAIRDLLVAGGAERWDPRGEALLHAAARRDHLLRTVWPALARGAWVVCDRFADSTSAYQGGGHGLPQGELDTLHAFVCGGFQPDLTVIFDLPVAVGLARAGRRGGGEDRYERMDPAFHQRLFDRYHAIADAFPERCRLIEADGAIEAVHARLWAVVLERFPELTERR
ncbi:dTMP kinase [Rhodospirillum rubrum]|uniref:dTMP kinase n=1 Tax=Rhodospirillum rubrum TaxID=1085 RepID=UPI0019048486|nr:dTMP kinase [Rhodospirillum rubrum]MBK1665624.1 dTMP kinase [Rhodospirillum rubrum]MBK1677469.1 dTMP kinase [Rhodospirillum rubrum]